jgi:hypothetical protein
VKSADRQCAWKFEDAEAVEWLVKYPMPIFLCAVSKKKGLIRIYHVFPRFQLWAMGKLPDRLKLVTGIGKEGKFEPWTESSSLSAPIIEVRYEDLRNKEHVDKLGKVFSRWVELDQKNCDRVRQGLLTFGVPASYTVNKDPLGTLEPINQGPPREDSLQPANRVGGAFEQDYNAGPEFVQRGVQCLGEALVCIGRQAAQRDNKHALAIEAALLADRLNQAYPDAFKDDPFVRHLGKKDKRRFSGMFETAIRTRLRKIFGDSVYSNLDEFLDAVEKEIANIPLIKQYVQGSHAETGDPARA